MRSCWMTFCGPQSARRKGNRSSSLKRIFSWMGKFGVAGEGVPLTGAFAGYRLNILPNNSIRNLLKVVEEGI